MMTMNIAEIRERRLNELCRPSGDSEVLDIFDEIEDLLREFSQPDLIHLRQYVLDLKDEIRESKDETRELQEKIDKVILELEP